MATTTDPVTTPVSLWPPPPPCSSPPPRERVLLLVKTGGPGRRRLLDSITAVPHLRVVCMNETANWATKYIREWILDPMTDAVAGLAAVQAYMATHGVAFDRVLSYDE